MPVLLQCPRCGFNYVKPVKEAGQLITCRRCQLVFTAAQDPIPPAPPPPPAEPPEVFPFSTPTTIPSTPTHFVLESETVHEVEQIEVLDEPGAQPPGSLEIDSAPPAGRKYDDVEVLAPPPQAKQTPPPLPAKAADAGPLPPPASPPAGAVDQVEVVVEPVLEIVNEEDRDRAGRVLAKTESACLITNSITARVVMEPVVTVEAERVRS